MPDVEALFSPPSPKAKPVTKSVDSLFSDAAAAAAAATPPKRPALDQLAAGAMRPIADMPAEYDRVRNRAVDNLKHDVTDPVKGIWGGTKRAVGTVGDAVDYMGSPVTAALNNLVGMPVETGAHGKISRDVPGAIAGMALPFLGESKIPGTAKKLGDTAKAIFHPAGYDDHARAAASIHRANLGKYGLTADKETYQLSKHAKTLGKLTPDEKHTFIDYVENRSTRATPPDAPDAAKLGISPRVNPRMARVIGAASGKLSDTKMQRAADAIAELSERYRKRIEYVLGPDDRRGYVKDYYAHMWKQKPEEVEARMAAAQGGKQGSGRNLRKRSVPTVSDGLRMGLELRYDNPVDAMIAYNENMAKFLRTHAIKDDMIKGKEAQWFFPGKQPAGWVPLEGALTKRRPMRQPRGASPDAGVPGGPGARRLPPPGPSGLAAKGGRDVLELFEAQAQGPGTGVVKQGVVEEPMPGRIGHNGGPQLEDAASKARRINQDQASTKAKPVRTVRDQPPIYEQLYAPEGAARIYNNHLSRGLDAPGAAGGAYRGARAVTNGLVQLRLGLSAFHAATMGNEAVTGAVAQAIEQASRGKPLSAAKTLGGAAAAPLTTPLRGRRMFKEIVGDIPADKVPEMNTRLNGLYEKAGGRLHMDRIYSPRGAGSFFQSALRGTLTQDVKTALQRTYQGSALENAKGVVDLAGNVIQSTAAPLFEAYIPALKRGAWAQRMEAFIKDHPDASEADLEKVGQAFLDNVDNRFGELMVDNNFWHKAGFQVSQLLLLSPSWNLGTIREIGGGIMELPKSAKGLVTGKGVTPKTAYVAALLATNAIINGSMTYMKTGEMPDGMDWFAYRTGGVNSDGTPERAALPGYMKDILAAVLGDPKQEIANKLSPGLKEAWELYNNKDYRGLPIYPDKGVVTAPGDRGLGDYLTDENLPISVQSLRQGQKQGSKISPAEAALSIRPSPRYVQSPEGSKEMRRKVAQRDWNKKRRSDARAASQRKPPANSRSVEELFN